MMSFLYCILLLLAPAISLRFCISFESNNCIFNEDFDTIICVLFGIASMLILLLLTFTIGSTLVFSLTLPFLLSIILIGSVNLIITRYYMPKIIHLLLDAGGGLFYFIGLIFMFFSAFWLPVVFGLTEILKQVTTKNYFYKLYVEQKNKGEEN